MFGAGAAYAALDFRDVHDGRVHVRLAIEDLQHTKAQNNYDKSGHCAKAEQLLYEAEKELAQAEELIKQGK